MTATAPARLASRRGARLALALAVAVLFLAPRLWRIEAVGEGTDEGFSVSATRALAEGRFSYSHLDDFRHDAYAAKFQPVAEAVAVPFLAILGDRPLAFRLPSLLAGAALLVLLLRHVLARHGRAAAAVLLALFLLDYRGVYYAQTHRYVALAQVLAFAAYLLVARPQRAGSPGAPGDRPRATAENALARALADRAETYAEAGWCEEDMGPLAEEAKDMPPSELRDRMRFALARCRETLNDATGRDALLGSLGAITRWKLCGPFYSRGASPLFAVHEPERGGGGGSRPHSPGPARR